MATPRVHGVTVNHVGQCVSNLGRARSFYVDVFGFAVVRELEVPDGALQAAAVAAGAGFERGVQASTIEGDRVRTRDGATLAARAIFLAAGKHGFRGFPREPAAWQRGDDR